jgi:Tfp pilus assembly protein PilF
LILAAALAFQPASSNLRRVFEDNLARQRREFGDADPHTAQAARDLALFLLNDGDRAAARRALADTLKLDESALGPAAPRTLEDAATLAGISPAAQAEPLYRRAAESPDASVAGPALSSLAALRKAAGDLAGAAALYRRALEKAESLEGRKGPVVTLLVRALAATLRQAGRAAEAAALERQYQVSGGR